MRQSLDEMFKSLEAGPAVYLPSMFWQQLNEKNISQLEDSGMANVKRTLAQNYFTWVVGVRSPIFRQLMKRTRLLDWPQILTDLPRFSAESGLGKRQFYELHIFTRMIWKLAERIDTRAVLAKVPEPEYGNPFRLMFNGRLISQDLANAVLEMYAITEARAPAIDEAFTVCELGAGYGRNAFVFERFYSHCKYIIVDIPPALYVSQEYLAAVLPDKKIMRFRPFERMEEVQDEFQAADVVFLLPHQAAELRAKSVDFFVNISSLHEMTSQQIATYFDMIERLTRGHFYTKQWKSFKNLRDGITISQNDYPRMPGWSEVFTRTPSSHPEFFESLFRVL